MNEPTRGAEEPSVPNAEQRSETKKNTDQSNLFTKITGLNDGDSDNQTIELTHESVSGAQPTQIGRYFIESILGSGGFGSVYLARDDQLERKVTIKVPHAHRLKTEEDVNLFLKEARTLAKLEHPNVVPIHDVGYTDEGMCYIVSRYIDGSDLNRKAKTGTLVLADSIDIIATIAEALHYVHSNAVIHRDIKPSNILLDKRGTAYLADFGLALLENEAAKSQKIMGTPSYMSPEQARGENHLVDRTSDIFSLGIVLHELVSGTRLFGGKGASETLRLVQEQEVANLRELNPDVPAELDRICMKALSKRAADRHATALDFAEDLRHLLNDSKNIRLLSGEVHASQSKGQGKNSVAVSRIEGMVPRGLRSFGNEDAHFFRELLPGPYNRDGIPESILFWKRKIEERDPLNSFRIGLIYGPSGCGKSSFVKAGLIPTLSKDVVPVFVEAAPEATENRLLNRLRRASPNLDPDLGLRESIAVHRHQQILGSNKKLVIVIDQFEQWLYTVENPEHSELAKALRQCDGEHVQVILLVRDDYWLAFSRFMEHLEVELRQNDNMMLVDLFSQSHARRVLLEFGRAYGKMPDRSSEMTREQKAFLTQAINELSENDKVTPVRLALLSEVIKARPWTVSTLRKIGGTAGVGVTFLEENFISDNAPADYRIHQKAAFAILCELLPQPGTNLKGHMRSYDELLAASGYIERPKEFQSLLRAMDTELHVITRTHPEGRGDELSRSLSGAHSKSSSESQEQSRSGSIVSSVYYQLAHDYLVPAIREWQSRLQKATRKGRAEIRLAERGEVWQARPESRHLPTWTEWVSILTFANRSRWNESQTRMMKKATKRYTIMTAVLAGGLLCTCMLGYQYLSWNKASSRTNQLVTASVGQVPSLLDAFKGNKGWSVSEINKVRSAHEKGTQAHLFLSLALLRYGEAKPQDVQDVIYECDLQTLALLSKELKPFKSEFEASLWETVQDESLENEINLQGRPFCRRFNAALLLANFEPPGRHDPKLGFVPGKYLEAWSEHDDYLADQLIYFANIERQHYATMMDLVRPLSPILVDQLSSVMFDKSDDELRRSAAQTLLIDLLSDDVDQLADLFLNGNTQQIQSILPILDAAGGTNRSVLTSAIRQPIEMEEDWESKARRKGTATAFLLRQGVASEEVWEMFRFQSVPDARTHLIQRLKPLGVNPSSIAQRLLIEQDDSIRCGLIQALGEFEKSSLSQELQDNCTIVLKGHFGLAKSSGLRSHALWLLRQWGEDDWIAENLHSPASEEDSRQWYVNSKGLTFIKLPRHSEANYRLDASMGEITVREFRDFNKDATWSTDYAPTKDCPCTHQTYNAVALYCNWLSREEGLSDDQLCYIEREGDSVLESEDALELVDDYQSRVGYRLPTAEEWFFLFHGGAENGLLLRER